MANTYTSKLKKRLPAVGDINWDDEWHDNEKIDDIIAASLLSQNRIISGGVVSDATGLDIDYTAIEAWFLGYPVSIIAGSLLLVAAQPGVEISNWIYIDNTGVVVRSTTPPSGSFIPLALVDVSDTNILRIADIRPMDDGKKDTSDGIAGLTLFKINFKNALGTIKSFFTNSNTAARTYTFQDRDGTIADDTDLALKAPLASPALTGNPTTPLLGSTDNSNGIISSAFLSNCFVGSAANAGYQKFKNGMVIQWANEAAHTTAETEKDHTFTLAFTAAYTIVCIPLNATSGIDLRIYTLSTTGFKSRCSLASCAMRYIAIGFITPS